MQWHLADACMHPRLPTVSTAAVLPRLGLGTAVHIPQQKTPHSRWLQSPAAALLQARGWLEDSRLPPPSTTALSLEGPLS